MYEFHNEGFFGYGEPGDFTYYSLAHIIPILLLILSIVFVYKNRERIRASKYEGRFRYILSFILMIALMSYYWRLLYVGDETGRYSLLVKLPLELCEIGAISAIFLLTSKNKFLFNYNFFVSLTFATAAILMPTVLINTGPRYYRYYQFWMVHLIPIFSVFYMMFIHDLKPSLKYMYGVCGVMILHALLAIHLNNLIPRANFLYLAGFSEEIAMGDNLMNYLPKNQYVRLLCICGISLVIFHLLYFAYQKAAGKKNEKTVSAC